MMIDRQGGWGSMALHGVDVYEVSGSHLSIFKEPHVRGLGAAIARCLDQLFEEKSGQASS